MEANQLHRAADTITELLKAHIDGGATEIDVHEAMAVRDEIRELANSQSDEIYHSFEVGEYAIDSNEPTPSTELNTVKVVDLIDQRADEYMTDDGKVVAEYENNLFYPDDDPVVAAKYPNLSSDETWYFPESRLTKQ